MNVRFIAAYGSDDEFRLGCYFLRHIDAEAACYLINEAFKRLTRIERLRRRDRMPA